MWASCLEAAQCKFPHFVPMDACVDHRATTRGPTRAGCGTATSCCGCQCRRRCRWFRYLLPDVHSGGCQPKHLSWGPSARAAEHRCRHNRGESSLVEAKKPARQSAGATQNCGARGVIVHLLTTSTHVGCFECLCEPFLHYMPSPSILHIEDTQPSDPATELATEVPLRRRSAAATDMPMSPIFAMAAL